MSTRARDRRRWNSAGHRRIAGWLLVLAVPLVAGCGSAARVQQRLALKMTAGDYPGALAVVERERNGVYGGRNRLLYHLDRGMLLHVSGEYAASNAAFEVAKRIGEDLYATRLGNAGLSLMVNDYALDYAGENFERTLIHLFSALNYRMLGDRESALVEVRQMGDYLRKLQVDSPNDNVYQEDAFARYLSALLYEGQGELDSAFVDFKKAAKAYSDYRAAFSVPPPGSLLPDAERVAMQLGRWAREDLEAFGSEGRARLLPEGAGEIIVLHYNGLLPVKDQTKITIPFSEAWLMVLALQVAARPADSMEIQRATAVASQIAGVDIVSVAFPKFVERPYSIARMQVRVDAALETTPPALVEDVGAIARKDLADRIARIRTRAIARAAIKYALQKAAEAAVQESAGEYGALLGAATQITGNLARFASEQADQRVWSTLPDEIWMSSVFVPAGSHDLRIDFHDAGGRVVESRVVSSVEVMPGEREFVIVRTVR